MCEQKVDVLPPKLSTAAATRARKALDAARRAHEREPRRGHAILAELHRAEALLETLRDRQDELDAKIATPSRPGCARGDDRGRDRAARGGADRGAPT